MQTHPFMKIYLVGGYVRDQLLRKYFHYDLPAGDRDWVVVGSCAQEMLDQGFLPVGKDFPVFLHPQTHEEYALARTERKVAAGYHGFNFYAQPDVTLEEDLRRRDLTINAMALDQDRLIDPYGGLKDLLDKRLRHVSAAFSEDPVRILRAARFCARLKEFHIARETLALMQSMVQNGESDALVSERVFQEMRRALMEPTPSRFVTTLFDCGLWQRLYPEIRISKNTLEVLDQSAAASDNECVRFTLLCAESEASSIEAFCRKIRPTSDIKDSLLLWQKLKNNFPLSDASQWVAMMEKTDAFRRPERFINLLTVARHWKLASMQTAQAALTAAQKVKTGPIALACKDKSKIGQAIHQARCDAVTEAI